MTLDVHFRFIIVQQIYLLSITLATPFGMQLLPLLYVERKVSVVIAAGGGIDLSFLANVPSSRHKLNVELFHVPRFV